MRNLRIALSVLAVAAIAALVIVAAAAAVGHRAAATKVSVTAKEFKFVLSKKSVPHGTVTFTVTNKGKVTHDFAIGGKKTKVLSPGKKQTLTVKLKKGRDAYRCTVDSHAKLGMKGVLKVT